METKTVVVNTGPLILLDKIGALDLFARLPFRFVCPPAVRMELDAGLDRSNSSIAPEWLTVVPLVSAVSPLVELSIDLGEAEVIQLALDRDIKIVCIDDLRGRYIAESFGLRVTGLLGMLGRAKGLGLIPKLRPLTDGLLDAGGRYSPKLIRGFLESFGEWQ